MENAFDQELMSPILREPRAEPVLLNVTRFARQVGAVWLNLFELCGGRYSVTVTRKTALGNNTIYLYSCKTKFGFVGLMLQIGVKKCDDGKFMYIHEHVCVQMNICVSTHMRLSYVPKAQQTK